MIKNAWSTELNLLYHNNIQYEILAHNIIWRTNLSWRMSCFHTIFKVKNLINLVGFFSCSADPWTITCYYNMRRLSTSIFWDVTRQANAMGLLCDESVENPTLENIFPKELVLLWHKNLSCWSNNFWVNVFCKLCHRLTHE